MHATVEKSFIDPKITSKVEQSDISGPDETSHDLSWVQFPYKIDFCAKLK